MPDVRIAACILFYEKLEQTIECIRSLLASGVPIYVLNNGSSQSARTALGEFCAKHRQVSIIDSAVNLGVGVGRNRLISESVAEWLLFVDNDITITTHDWLDRIKRHMENNPSAEVFIPGLYSVHENRYVIPYAFALAGDTVNFQDITGGESNCFPGGAAFVRRQLFDRLGLYDDRMFVGMEDYELAIRGIMEGQPVRARLVGDIELVHDHRRITTDKDKKAVSARYDVKSIESSYKRIKEKHNIKLKHGWSVKLWVINEARRMTEQKHAFLEMLFKALSVRAALRNFSFRRFLSIFGGGPIPRSCTLYMTDKCSLKCGGCSRQTTGVRTVGEMKLDTVQRMVSLYPSINSFCIAGFGEPTLCSDFVAIVDFLKMRKKNVGIITNGTNVDKLLQLRYVPDYISISLCGFDNESYAAYCGVPAFEQVVRNYRTLRERYRNVGFSYITNKETCRSLDRILHLCDELMPQFVHLLNHLVYDPDNEEDTRKIISVKDKDLIKRIEELCKNRKYVKLKPYYVDFDDLKMNCKSYNDVINLDGGGNIGGCQRKVPPDIRFGNIFKDKDPFNSQEMRRLREKVNARCNPHDVCKTCFANWIK